MADLAVTPACVRKGMSFVRLAAKVAADTSPLREQFLIGTRYDISLVADHTG